MSQTATVPYLDGEFEILEQEPSTLDELKELIGEAAVVDGCNDDLRYRNKYPRVYRAVSKAVEALGFPRAVVKEETKKDGTIKKIQESANDHLRAYLNGRFDKEGNQTEAAPDGSRDILGELFQKHATEEPIYVKGERTGGGGKVGQQALDAANGFFAQGVEVVESKVAIIEERVPGYKIARDADEQVTVDSLARGIQALQRHAKKQAEEAAKLALK